MLRVERIFEILDKKVCSRIKRSNRLWNGVVLWFYGLEESYHPNQINGNIWQLSFEERAEGWKKCKSKEILPSIDVR